MENKVYFVLFLFLMAGIFSCKNQDDVYQEFVQKGGYVYPQKTNDVAIYSGYKRVKLVWAAPKDPSVKRAKVYWSNRTKEIDVNYENYTGNQIGLYVDSLEEMSYTFELMNFDAEGNQSMTSEITASPYAGNWLMTHAERTISSAEIKDSAANILMSYGTNEMVATRFRYVNKEGKTVILDKTMDAASNKISLPGAVSGKRFEFSSSYCPSGGLDTIWNEWSKSPDPISGLLDCRAWGVEVTANQIYGSNVPSNVFDGIVDANHRWHSSTSSAYRNIFPKIMAVDAKADSYYINKIILYQHPTTTSRYANSVEIYWGNEPFDPNAGSDYATSPGFAKAIAKNTYLTTTFYFGTAVWSKIFSEIQNFRYFAIVWKDSRSTYGYNDLFELEFYGYNVAAED